MGETLGSIMWGFPGERRRRQCVPETEENKLSSLGSLFKIPGRAIPESGAATKA
jgi:hypothetical protein